MNPPLRTPPNLPDGCTDADIERAWGGDTEEATFEQCMEWLSEQAPNDISDIIINDIVMDLTGAELYAILDAITGDTKPGQKLATHIGAIVERELGGIVTEKINDA